MKLITDSKVANKLGSKSKVANKLGRYCTKWQISKVPVANKLGSSNLYANPSPGESKKTAHIERIKKEYYRKNSAFSTQKKLILHLVKEGAGQ